MGTYFSTPPMQWIPACLLVHLLMRVWLEAKGDRLPEREWRVKEWELRVRFAHPVVAWVGLKEGERGRGVPFRAPCANNGGPYAFRSRALSRVRGAEEG